MANPSELLDEIKGVNRRLRNAEARMNDLLARRRELYVEARHADEPIPYPQLAAASGTTDAAVMQVVVKAERAEVAAWVGERLGRPLDRVEAKKVADLVLGSVKYAQARARLDAMSDRELNALLG